MKASSAKPTGRLTQQAMAAKINVMMPCINALPFSRMHFHPFLITVSLAVIFLSKFASTRRI